MENNAIISWQIQDCLSNTPESLANAFFLAQEGAKAGCAHSIGALARCYYYGNGVAKNVTMAEDLAKESAASNSAYGQFMLGHCLKDGNGGNNDVAASKQYRLAADQGLAIAQHNLGIMLFYGLGVDENEDEAELLWYLAVLQGYNLSYRMLAYKYEKDQPDNPAVATVFEAAAALGDANAEWQLGLMYEQGRGVFQDTKKAMKLYNSAGLKGLDQAHDAVEKALKCNRCRSRYDKSQRAPLMLPCGCTFCRKCIEQGSRIKLSKCPACGKACGAAILMTNEGVKSALGRGDEKSMPAKQPKGLKRKQLKRAAAALSTRLVILR
jgi:TPR repeat protein